MNSISVYWRSVFVLLGLSGLLIQDSAGAQTQVLYQSGSEAILFRSPDWCKVLN